MSNMIFPDPRFRSPTAVDGKSDFRDENIYSALVLANGAAGQAKLFTVPQGQNIPELKGAGITATTQPHQQVFSSATTNLTKAGELGSGIGDAAIRGIGLSLETAAVTPATGVARGFGATQFEVADILSKCSFSLRVANKPQITGNVSFFPSAGGSFGSISTTGNAATASVASNGWPGSYKRLKIPIPVARNDTLEGVFEVAGSSALAFSVTSGEGQPTLLYVNLASNVAGDVR